MISSTRLILIAIMGAVAAWGAAAPHAADLQLNVENHCVPVGETGRAILTGAPGDAQVEYSVDNPQIASIDPQTGSIEGRAVGVTTIYAQVDDQRTSFPLGVPERYLTPEDFEFDGQYASPNGRVEQIGVNEFIVRGNRHYEIDSNLRGNRFAVHLTAVSGPPSSSHPRVLAYSTDNFNWTSFDYEVSEHGALYVHGPFAADHFYHGGQIPMSHEAGEAIMQRWTSDPRTAKYISVREIGRSYQGRPLYAMEITDPDSDIPREQRWVHWVSSAHPHEGKARWRVYGVVDWLLSDDPEAADARRRSIWHASLMMCPDSIRVYRSRYNMQGRGEPYYDMNRSYLAEGSDPEGQIVESYHFQKEIERIMATDEPLTTFQDFHVWGNQVEPMMRPGPEFGAGPGKIGEVADLREMLEANDPQDMIKPLAVRGGGGTVLWDGGVHAQFGITSSLVEGGGTLLTQEENVESGRIYARTWSQFWHGDKSRLQEQE